jgi:hypothetical protein
MNNNKRQRTDEEEAVPAPSPPTTARVPKLRLSDELATKLGTRYCTDNELVRLMLSQEMCSRVSTFEVKATLMGDLNEWMTITLDDEHASTADVKAGVEQAKGTRPAMQELFRYDESWTGTKGCGGSGHSTAQEDTALVEEGFGFEGPCSLMVSVNESYAVVLEGLEEGETGHTVMGVYEGEERQSMMGAHERVEGNELGGKGVWQAVGGFDRFLHYHSAGAGWVVTSRGNMEAGSWKCFMRVESTATAPDQITEQWKVCDGTAWYNAPKLRVRVCSSVEKHAAEQCVEQQEEQAMAQAKLSRRLVVEGVANAQNQIMGDYELMEGKVLRRRAVWQKQGGGEERFLYYSRNNSWVVSRREHMEAGSSKCLMKLKTTALTPDQARLSGVWKASGAAGAGFLDAPEVQVRRQT